MHGLVHYKTFKWNGRRTFVFEENNSLQMDMLRFKIILTLLVNGFLSDNIQFTGFWNTNYL